MKKWLLCAALLAALCVPAQAISAQRALVLDTVTGEVLYARNADERSLIASTTKIMTGYLIARDCDLQREFEIPPEATGMEGSSLYLRPGERLRLEELLYGLMLQSGNDAAVALALAHSGSVAAFVDCMNAEAQALGLRQTHFANPNGLDSEENYSTARDLARLAACAMENPVFRTVVGTREYRAGSRCLCNHNKLLWRYPGAEGVKTGYTRAAGRILVSSARRDGRRLIAVTLSAPDDWNDHTALLDEAFSRYTPRTLCRAGEILGAAPADRPGLSCVGLAAAESVQALARPGEQLPLTVRLQRCAGAVRPGEPAGTAEFYWNGHLVGSCGLVGCALAQTDRTGGNDGTENSKADCGQRPVLPAQR